ncbi:MAG: hypothetical protein FJ333_03355 [Sphingomonadales bacterium]|nr:hypothetical protein [Sphingomonadales bacterium]
MSENRQFVENPLLLTDLFPNGIYHFKEPNEEAIVLPQVADNESGKVVVLASAETVGSPEIAVEENEINAQILTGNNPEEDTMITLTIINLIFDATDVSWDEATKLSYDKLMSAVKVNQESVLSEDIEMVMAVGEAAYSPELLGDRLSPVIFVWSDRDIAQIPALYKARPTEKGVMVRFPSFAAMCANLEMKKMVWQTMKQVLKF